MPKSKSKKKTNLEEYIQPYRIIPFDIGCKLTEEKQQKIKKALDIYPQIEDKFLEKLSEEYLLGYQIAEGIKLYIYKFGIGVLSVKDVPYELKEDSFAIKYCHSRRENHFQILNFNHALSPTIREIISIVRNSVQSKKEKYRKSSQDTWEYNGLSYVMTISFLISKKIPNDYDKMNILDKKNLLIMLEPSIVHEEDSLMITLDSINNEKDLYNFDPNLFESPNNWLKNKDIGIYISWAAVLFYMEKWDEQYYSFIESLEVDLQAMWLYVYCLYRDTLTKTSNTKKVSELKRNLYEFSRKYNEFKNIDDSSMPTYFPTIRNEIINTSKIEEEKEKYVQYLEFCIEETTSINIEKQKKYSWLNEILLYIIAFIQIAPMLYKLLLGQYTELVLWPIILMAIIIIISIVIIIRKE